MLIKKARRQLERRATGLTSQELEECDMETKYKTDATERKVPMISVNVHLDDTSSVSVEKVEGSIWIALRGWGYSCAAIHLSRDKLAEVRDVIAAHLEASE